MQKNKSMLTLKESIPLSIKTFCKKYLLTTYIMTANTLLTSTQSIDITIARGEDNNLSFYKGVNIAI